MSTETSYNTHTWNPEFPYNLPTLRPPCYEKSKLPSETMLTDSKTIWKWRGIRPNPGFQRLEGISTVIRFSDQAICWSEWSQGMPSEAQNCLWAPSEFLTHKVVKCKKLIIAKVIITTDQKSVIKKENSKTLKLWK